MRCVSNFGVLRRLTERIICQDYCLTCGFHFQFRGLVNGNCNSGDVQQDSPHYLILALGKPQNCSHCRASQTFSAYRWSGVYKLCLFSSQNLSLDQHNEQLISLYVRCITKNEIIFRNSWKSSNEAPKQRSLKA